MKGRTNIWVLLGPTASGKSSLALALARRMGAEILSVDSMQVYRRMDVGTAKPSRAEQEQVPHHLIDVVNPDEAFSVARFVEQADAVIVDAAKRGVPLIATGGTPLYFKALFHGLFEGPSADPMIRERLGQLDDQTLHDRLSSIDPAAAGRIHRADRKRLIRAIEVYELTGEPISGLQQQWSQPPHRHVATWIGLSWEKSAVNRRINARVKGMMADGFLEEVRQLLADYSELSHTAAEATGYKELISHLRGQLSLEEAVEQIKISTRQLARRQMKWFVRFPGVRWINGDQTVEALIEDVLARQ